MVHGLSFADVAERLPEGLAQEMGEAGWEAIRPNLTHIAQAADLWKIVTGPVNPPDMDEETRAYLAQAAQSLAAMDWGEDPWHALTATLKQVSGRKGKALFLPLREALTGRAHGPDMGALLPLIGKEAALERLSAAS